MSEQPKGYCPLFGNYPAEYNRAVHGPFYPWVNYNKRDIPIQDVKLGELRAWLGRRNYTPQAMIAATSRMASLWHKTWLQTRYGSPAKGMFQFMVLYSTVSMLCCYGYLKSHRNHKYHW